MFDIFKDNDEIVAAILASAEIEKCEICGTLNDLRLRVIGAWSYYNEAMKLYIAMCVVNNDDIDVTGAKIKKVAMSDAYNKSIFMPVLYMDKNMECHEKETSMCYDCSGSYKWLVVGEQDEVCTPLPDKKNESECTNEACYDCNGEYKWFEMGKQDESCEIIKSIDVKSKCAKAPKTGVEDYILEFFIILTVGALVLFVVKKNDLFKTI